MDDAAYEALMARLNEAYPSQPAYTPADVKLQSGQITRQQGQDPVMLMNPRTLQQGESNPIDFDQSGGIGQLGAMVNAGRLRGMLDMSAQDGMTPGYNAMATMQLPEGYSASYRRSNEIGGLGDAQNAIMLAKQFGEPNTPSPSLNAGASRSGMNGPITYDLSASVPLTTGRNPEAPQFRLPSSREEQPMVPPSRRDRERQPSHQEVRGAATAGLSHSPRSHSTSANAGLKFNFADGGHVDAALHLLRQHFDEGGFLDSLRGMFSGPEVLSTGEKIVDDGRVNWGNPDLPSDFFRADKAALALAKRPTVGEPGDDVTGSVPAREPLTAPRLGVVKATELAPPPDQAFTPVRVEDLVPAPVNIPLNAPERGVPVMGASVAPASFATQPIAYSPEAPAAPAQAAIGKLTARAPQDVEQPATNAQILAAIRANESRNNPKAQNPTSSAGGLYQFLNSTWGNTLRRMDPERFGAYSDRQLRGLKTSADTVDLQHAAANYHLANDIAPRLSKAGVPLTPGSAYLSWFQGPGGAVKAYTAPDDATVAQVFPKTVSANANMRFNGKPYAQWTMSDLRQWADTAMSKRMGRAHGGLVDDALHVVREHHADGEAVGQVPVATDNSERVRAAESAANLAKQIQAYEASMAGIRQQPQDIQSMTHAPEKPRAPISVEALGKNREFGSAPYDVAGPLSILAQGAYDLKTAPLYAAGMAFPPAAALGTAIDTAEGVAAGSPTQVAMGALGGPLKVARNVIAPLAVATGVAAPDEAEAGSLERAMRAIRAYHGSPHKFDRFDMSKIGTGEGAQAYGHGLYLAEHEPTAKFYRDALSDMFVGEKPFNINDPLHKASSILHDEALGDRGRAISIVQNQLARDHDPFNANVLRILETGKDIPAPVSSGHMYEVNINARPEQLLNWDKPLIEQGHVIDALRRSRSKNMQEIMSNPDLLATDRKSYGVDIGPMTGEDLFRRAAIASTGKVTGGPNTTKMFVGSGIPGIKYLDAESRGVTAAPSHNYVIFNDKLIDINRRYAQGGDVEPASVEDRALMLVSRQA